MYTEVYVCVFLYFLLEFFLIKMMGSRVALEIFHQKIGQSPFVSSSSDKVNCDASLRQG